jgi:hypothetical protein
MTMTPRQRHLSFLDYATAEWQARNGYMTDDEWTWYRCAWRNSAPRFSDIAREHAGHNPDCCPFLEPTP